MSSPIYVTCQGCRLRPHDELDYKCKWNYLPPSSVQPLLSAATPNELPHFAMLAHSHTKCPQWRRLTTLWKYVFHIRFSILILLLALSCVQVGVRVCICVSLWVRECVLVCVVSLSALLLKFTWVQSQQGGNYQAERSNGQLGATCRLINQLLGSYTASPFLTFLSRTVRVLFKTHWGVWYAEKSCRIGKLSFNYWILNYLIIFNQLREKNMTINEYGIGVESFIVI